MQSSATLLYFPVPGYTHAWHPEAATPTAAAFAHAHALDGPQRFVKNIDRGPVALAVEPAGSIYAGTLIAAYAGDIYIVAPRQGFIAATHPAGFTRIERLRGIAGVAVAPGGGPVYLTRISSHFSWDDRGVIRFAHDTSGSLPRYDPRSGRIEIIADDFAAPHGVVLGPGGDDALVVETNAYRILRVWLTGERAGRREVFAGGLPGFPAYITFNGTDRYWVSIPTARMPALDALAQRSAYRRFLLHLPASFTPHSRIQPQGLAIGFDLDGHRIAELRGAAATAYAPVTAAAESRQALWLASDHSTALARLALTAPLPPAPVIAPPDPQHPPHGLPPPARHSGGAALQAFAASRRERRSRGVECGASPATKYCSGVNSSTSTAAIRAA